VSRDAGEGRGEPATQVSPEPGAGEARAAAKVSLPYHQDRAGGVTHDLGGVGAEQVVLELRVVCDPMTFGATSMVAAAFQDLSGETPRGGDLRPGTRSMTGGEDRVRIG
jgi:hypothetical protein